MAATLSAPQREWLADLYEEHATTVFHLCRRLLKDPEDAADAAHEVFLKVAQSPDRQPTENMRPWLLIVTRNHCFDVLRRQKRAGRVVAMLGRERLSTTAIDPEGAVIQRRTLETVLTQLTARERMVLWQSAVEHLGPASIAQRHRLNYMAAAKVVSRAKKHAALIAAAVAAVLLSLRPDRVVRRIGLVSTRLAATAIPIVALTLQPSSSAPPAYPPVSSQAITTNVPSHAIGTPSSPLTIPSPLAKAVPPVSQALPPIGINAPALPIPSGVDKVTHALPTPSLPSVTLPTPTLPSLPVGPTPPPHR